MFCLLLSNSGVGNTGAHDDKIHLKDFRPIQGGLFRWVEFPLIKTTNIISKRIFSQPYGPCPHICAVLDHLSVLVEASSTSIRDSQSIS